MNRPHFRRHPRPVDPNPEYSRLDRLDGLHTRYDAELPDVIAAEWSSLPPVFAPHSFVGGDLAAMAAPADYGEGYDIETEATLLSANADALAAMAAPLPGMAQDDLGTYAEPVEPHGRHRQTDPLDLLLADLRDIEDRLS